MSDELGTPPSASERASASFPQPSDRDLFGDQVSYWIRITHPDEWMSLTKIAGPERRYRINRIVDAVTELIERALVETAQPLITRDEAIAAGLYTYRTGAPCRHGHYAPRYVSDDHCAECIRQHSRDYYRRKSAELPE